MLNAVSDGWHFASGCSMKNIHEKFKLLNESDFRGDATPKKE